MCSSFQTVIGANWRTEKGLQGGFRVDAEAIRDLFSGLGPVTIKRMFGGKGIYHRGVIFAIDLGSEELMLKADETSAPDFEAAGAKQWVYTHAKTGKTAHMPYWTVPDEALDDPDVMADWARKAYEAGVRADAGKSS